MKIEIDSDLNTRVDEKVFDPIVFVPDVDLRSLKAPNIIEDF